MPGLFGSLPNYLVPIYVGYPEIIFPRLKNASVILSFISLLILVLALLTEYSVGPGWTVLVILGLAVSG